MSWLRGGAQEWNQKFSDTLSRAASSVQRLAEQAELTQLGEHFLASAQNLAEQSEAAWSNVADKVTGGVSSLGLSSEDSPRRDRDLAQQFVKEAKQLESSGTARLMVADVAQVLHLWQERLSAASAPNTERSRSSTPLEPAALKALLQSKAMHLALTSLTRSRAGRAVLSAAADAKEDRQARPVLEFNAAASLKEILGHTCAGPAPLVKQLLTLLSEAAEENCQARREGAKALIDSAAQDLQWILALFCASFLDASEVGDPGELGDLDLVLTGASPDASPASPDVAETAGTEVWACWPGDGRWFRAKVTSVRGSSVAVAWLRRGSEKVGEEDEYLSSTGCDELLFTRLPHASVVTAKDRPAQAVVEKADRWRQQLGRVEELSQRFRSLRNVCNKMAAQSAGPLPRDPLQGLAEQLAALRSESEARMADLLGAAEARASAGGGINEQLTSSTEGFQVEIDSMHQEQQALQSRLKQLQAERQELVKKLQALDEEIAVATSAYQASTQRERQVRASQKRVAGELKRELSIEEVEARKVGDRQRLLMEATAASKDIEGLLESRTETAKARLAAWEQLGERQAKAQGVCLQSEKERARACEELLAGWHAAVWGPDAQDLSRDPEALTTLRQLHQRSSGSLQQAWKDTVQLAAECLGDDGSEELSRAAERYKAMLKEIKSNLDRMKVLEAAKPDPRAAPSTGSTSAQSGTTSEEAVPSPAAVPPPAAAAAQPEAVPEAAAQEEDEAE